MRITQRTVDIRYIFSIICEVFTDVFFFTLVNDVCSVLRNSFNTSVVVKTIPVKT